MYLTFVLWKSSFPMYPPTPRKCLLPLKPLPLGISNDLPWRAGMGGMDIFWNHTIWWTTIVLHEVSSLFIRRLQNFMITLYKSLFFTNYPGYLKDMFTVRSSSYNLRGNHILALPNPKTTTYGLHSFSYLASKIWNSLPDTYKTLNFLEFKQEILRYEAFPQ